MSSHLRSNWLSVTHRISLISVASLFTSMSEITRPDQTLPVEWRPRTDIEPNTWNPNEMGPDKRRELVYSIVDNGWTQPIVIRPDGTIIDGEQRWHAARDSRVRTNDDLTPDGIDAGYVPVFVVNPDEAQARVATVQHDIAGEMNEQGLGALFARLDDRGLFYDVSERLTLSETGIDRLIAKAESDGEEPDAWHEEVDDPEPAAFDESIGFRLTESEHELVMELLGTGTLVELCRWAVSNNVHSQTRVDMRTLSDRDAEYDPEEEVIDYPSVDVERHLSEYITDDDPEGARDAS